MVDDKEQYGGDEYQFADLDTIDPDESLGEEEGSPTKQAKSQPSNSSNEIRRKALIVIGIVVVIMILYKLSGAFIAKKPTSSDMTNVPPPVTRPSTPKQVEVQQPVLLETTQPNPTTTVQSGADNAQLTEKLSALESSEQNLSAEISAINNQITSISTNVSDLTTKVADLSRMLIVLAEKVDQQSNQIALLAARTAPKKRAPRFIRPVVPRVTYYIQAVIPGRAWLIATNGSTLTVREGTLIAGYGVVRLIDARQGRVVTSSGQVIRFSQQDS